MLSRFEFQAWEEASKAVKDEEAFKQKLCEDLNNLVDVITCCIEISLTFPALLNTIFLCRYKRVVMLN